ncbi:hypothetical protein Taro_053086 [Colocasia esculenta]|uniref:Uncharacterized protein n=1 Tax=Colocasia esculenta TaxID=4460 RepID=A0A843XLJ3_COLES|nr:hypothetical protein [Colocasia esculenta]
MRGQKRRDQRVGVRWLVTSWGYGRFRAVGCVKGPAWLRYRQQTSRFLGIWPTLSFSNQYHQHHLSPSLSLSPSSFRETLQQQPAMQEELCDLKVQINGQQFFFLNQRILCMFSGKLRRMIKQERKKGRSRVTGLKIADFPTDAEGFELAARFCYNNGAIQMTPSNVCLLHCAAASLEMTDGVAGCNLLSQTETFLDGLFYWTWRDVLNSLKSCEPFLDSADESGLLQKLISSLLGKISANSEIPLTMATPFASSSSSSSSPDASGLRFSSSTKTPESVKPCFSREWWFDDLTVLHPKIVEKLITTLGAYGTDNRNLILTRFLLHYLKTALQRTGGGNGDGDLDYSGLADTAVYGVVLMGRTSFSCRGLFWVLRVVSGLGLSKDCRNKLEKLMGSMLDQATLDDLLVSGHDGGVYDVNLVLRLLRVFASTDEGGVPLQRMKTVGRLMDKYLGEISPDPNLKVSKFLGVAESLPDSARDCFVGVYRALDIYLESHPTLSFEERSRLCRCLNYEKLTLEACKDLAKNPRIPPRSAVQALASQRSKLQNGGDMGDGFSAASSPAASAYHKGAAESESPEYTEEKEELRLNLQMMQWRVAELEKVCREMKGQMSKMAKSSSKVVSGTCYVNGRGLPRLC